MTTERKGVFREGGRKQNLPNKKTTSGFDRTAISTTPVYKMADALSLLRQYNMQKKPIVDSDDQIVFDQFAFPKVAKTNYLIYKTGKDGLAKDYYTLESLLFLLKNVALSYPLYVQRAVAQKIPVVRLPDRRGVLSYLNGEVDSSPSVDKSAPLELGVQRSASVGKAVKRPPETEEDSTAKKQRLEEQEAKMKLDRERLAAKLDAPKQNELLTDKLRSLSEALPVEKIAAIKAMRLAKKRATVKAADNEMVTTDISKPEERTFLTADTAVTHDILSRERLRHTRKSVLHSTGKNFSNVLAVLSSVYAREDGAKKRGSSAHNESGRESKSAPVAYNRYDQERFGTREETAEGFTIDTMGTYHGLSLKSVTEKAAKVQQKSSSAAAAAAVAARAPASGHEKPPPSQARSRSVPHAKSPTLPKKESRTPIVIIPAAVTSLLTMYNVRDFLQDYRFVSVEEKKHAGAKREVDVMIQRKKANGSTVLYRVVDNPMKLSSSEWERVVAVFVHGPAWQFKGWPWLTADGSPVDIFAKVQAFHLKFEGFKTDLNVQKWNVQLIEISRTKRHLDYAAVLQFWQITERFIAKSFPQLHY
ncbi:parafibromin-like [Oscarella lobularis]|uniref:parafibromin-like n=1 Tax=Oscarella lobularis TaxID=121494 RepID=UPI00331320C7